MRDSVQFQKRPFEFIAQFVRVHFGGTVTTKHDIAHMLAVALKDTNPQFDRDKFIAACLK